MNNKVDIKEQIKLLIEEYEEDIKNSNSRFLPVGDREWEDSERNTLQRVVVDLKNILDAYK